MVDWTRQRGIGLGLLAVWGVLFILVWLVIPLGWFYTAPSVEFPVSLYGGTRLSTYPTVTYYMDVTFKADGSFSVGNPVHVNVVLTRPNNTRFLSSYCCATLTGALNIPPTMGVGNAKNTVFADRIYLTAYPNGSYIGSADIKFVEAGGQDISLIPPPNLSNPAQIILEPGFKGGIPYPYNLSKPTSTIVVSDSSATLGIDTTRFVAKISILVGTFSIILLQPVLEAILIPKSSRNQSTETNTQDSRPPTIPPKPSIPNRQKYRKRYRIAPDYQYWVVPIMESTHAGSILNGRIHVQPVNRRDEIGEWGLMASQVSRAQNRS